MIDFLQAYMAPVMFAGLILFLLMGYSVAFSLAACGLMFGWIGVEIGMLPASLLQEVLNTGTQERRFVLEDSRSLTFVNVGDSRALQNTEIVAGDVLFHKHLTADKMPNPETPAQKILDHVEVVGANAEE